MRPELILTTVLRNPEAMRDFSHAPPRSQAQAQAQARPRLSRRA
jgi:hypothetical protein